MRWQTLFGDIEGAFEAELAAEDRDRRREELREQWSRNSLRLRLEHLSASPALLQEPALAPELTSALEPTLVHHDIRLQVAGVILSGKVDAVGYDWCAGTFTSVEASTARYLILPLTALERLWFDCDCAPKETELTPPPTSRIPLGIVLRDLVRRRRPVELGTVQDMTTGTLQRVGRNWVDVAAHAADDMLSATAVRQCTTIPVDQLRWIHVLAR